MSYVGYIAGDTLEEIQRQWAGLWEGEVNFIIFDRECLKGFNLAESEKYPDKKKIFDYMEAMRAGQYTQWSARQLDDEIDSGDVLYEFLEDLLPDDRLVIHGLGVLPMARPDIWEKIVELDKEGVHLIVLSEGFSSAGEYGDVMMKMMNELYQFGCSKREP